MVKKTACLLLSVVTALLICGCGNYRGLDEMSVVAGMAIDKGDGGYKISFEVVDLSANVKQEGVKTLLLEAEGKTFFDAARNAKRRIQTKLYFGHMQTIVISEEIARGEDIGSIIDWFLRSNEFRETMCIMVSKEKTAREILSPEGLASKIKSFELYKIAKEDSQHTSSTSFMEIYNMFNILNGIGRELALPAVHMTKNDEKEISEIDGTAVFKGERLAGYLSPEESKYFLFAAGLVKGGLLTFSDLENDTHNITLEITENKTDTSFRYEDDVLSISIKTETTANLTEADKPVNALDTPQITSLEVTAQDMLAHKTSALVKKVQTEFGSDIFGFGSMIYKKNPALWRKIGGDWDALFPKVKVTVESKVRIANSALLKDA